MTNKKNDKKKIEKTAIISAVVFLLLGILLIWFLRKILNIEKDSVFISLLLIPILIYAIVSGRLTELKGPGGLEAKFAESASASISIFSETVEPSVEDMQEVEKASMQTIEEKRDQLIETAPIVMTMRIGRANYYSRELTLRYIETLSQFRNFLFVVFLDNKDRYVAYMPQWSLKGLLRMEMLGNEFINLINDGRSHDLFRFPGVIKETISTKSSNVEALAEMTKYNLEALVVIDENHHLKGVVERDQIISKMLLALTK